jgi:hypothetical protein
VEPVKQE